MERKNLEWKTISSNKILTTPIFDVYEDHRVNNDQTKKGKFVHLESKDWVLIIPYFKKDESYYFIMENQFRHGENKVTTEFPAGLVEKGEEAIKAARRELLEETGLEGDFTLLGCVNPNPAFMSNRQYVYLAENLKKVQEQNLDENEEIEVVELSVDQVLKKMGEAPFNNGIMMMALGFFLRYRDYNIK